MVHSCTVKGCKTRGCENPTIHFYGFPLSNTPLCRRWELLCGISKHVSKYMRICSLHFQEEDFYFTNKTKRIRDNVEPSLRLPVIGVVLTHNVDVTVAADTTELFVKINNCLLRIRIVPGTCSQDIFEATQINQNANVVQVFEQAHIKKLKSENKGLRNRVQVLQRINGNIRMLKTKVIGKLKKKYLTKRKMVASKDQRIEKLKGKVEDFKSVQEKALSKFWSKKQIDFVLNNKIKAKWTNEEIARGISLRYKSNLYECLRLQGLPYPSTRVLQKWTQKIDMKPGILFPVINLLKQEFEYIPEIKRQCILSFDEVSIDSHVEYDPADDTIYGPKTNMNVTFVRGLFSNFKQPISYDFDEAFSAKKFLETVEILEQAGIRVRANVNDLGGKNRGLWNRLGVKVRKVTTDETINYEVNSCVKNPFSGDMIWFFADIPHLIKLLRNNLFNHGLTLQGGHVLLKSDIEKLISLDCEQLRSVFKLTEKHFNLTGKQKQNVLLAVQIISNTVAEAFRLAYPNKGVQADFIQLINDFFDMMNSRTIQQAMLSKKPFGLNIDAQMELLNKVDNAMVNLIVGNSQSLFPFQRGFLITINSMKGLFTEMSESSLRIKYILTHRLNQDIAENAFSMIRKVGVYNDNPTPVEAKKRLKLLMLSWGRTVCNTSSVEMEGSETDQPFLTGRMLDALVRYKDLNKDVEQADEEMDVNIREDMPEVNMLDEDNVEEVLQSMGISQRLNEGGKEYLTGFVASKFKNLYPEVCASPEELKQLKGLSWVIALNKGGLTVPSLGFRNTCYILDREFENYHQCHGDLSLNKRRGVYKGFCLSLASKYPDIPFAILQRYIKSRLSIRIKAVNRDIDLKRLERQKFKHQRITVYEPIEDEAICEEVEEEIEDLISNVELIVDDPETCQSNTVFIPGQATAEFFNYLEEELLDI